MTYQINPVKPKRILVVIGAGMKNGNTEQLADSFIRGAEEIGHSVKKQFLGGKKINFCIGCNKCRGVKQCIHKDDMTQIYDDFAECDLIVLASPLYFWSITGMLKTFIDRLYAAKNNKDKECILLMTARQNSYEAFEHAVSYYQLNCITHMGWNDRGMVLAGGCGGVKEERLIRETRYLTESYRLGKNI